MFYKNEFEFFLLIYKKVYGQLYVSKFLFEILKGFKFMYEKRLSLLITETFPSHQNFFNFHQNS